MPSRDSHDAKAACPCYTFPDAYDILSAAVAQHHETMVDSISDFQLTWLWEEQRC